MISYIQVPLDFKQSMFVVIYIFDFILIYEFYFRYNYNLHEPNNQLIPP